MIIRTDQIEFDTDRLILVDRVAEDHVVVILDTETLDLRGDSARQAFAQITEHEEVISRLTPENES